MKNMLSKQNHRNSERRWAGPADFLQALNGQWHRSAMFGFLIVVLAHWAEHLLQAYQIWILHWHRPHAQGALGLIFPWLVTSEWLHYGYALIMLVGFLALRPAFTGRGLWWWNMALAIQFWHHFEHALLLGQALTHRYLLGGPTPTSLIQLVIPRVELHLFYNAVVFVPMLVAMFYHRYPPTGEPYRPRCTCAHLGTPSFP